ncbi:HBL/NHE enterotoxin family protein [Bacillus spongiae]|uniref:HBL/NHE enterotoxin family protein n=1 Tax=Bacillus spongiae TaxID=2683610 RepID=A0ABU8HFY6_9BACI
MKKPFYRKLLVLLVIFSISTSTTNVIPFQVLASESEQETNSLYSLGPAANFQDAMDSMASNMLVMDTYSRTLLEQTAVDLTGVNFIHDGLKSNIETHQQTAKTNANYWLNNLKPYMIEVNEDIVEYHSVFQERYSVLLTAVNQQDTITLQNEVEALYKSIVENKKNTDDLLSEFVSFRQKMAEDSRSFNFDIDEVMHAISTRDSGIPLLQQQIEQHNESIKKNQDLIIAGAFLCVTIIGCIAGGPMIASAKSNIDFANGEISKLNSEITESQAAITNLTTIKSQISYLNDTINVAINSLQNMSNQWNVVAAKYSSLLQNIETIDPDVFIFIEEDLSIARDSWEDLKEYANKLYEGTQLGEEELNSIAS